MNPSTAQAEVLVDELVRNGVRQVVLAPGSRNAPLSFALHDAAEAGRLDLHVRIDERSAGFLALGIATRTRRPVVVVCTSGTAATNLHPAVSEACHAGIPLIVLTADRPPELRAAGANQTIDQYRLYGTEVRLFDELAVAENRPGQNAYWRTQVCRAASMAAGTTWGGPVHLNLPFREPLVPSGDRDWCEPLDGRADGQRWTEVSGNESAPSTLSKVRSRRGLVLVADGGADSASAWGERYGWPVLSETGGVGLSGAAAISTGMWLLKLPGFMRDHRPEQVLCVGRNTVFRQVQSLLADSEVEVLLAHGGSHWPTPAHNVREVAETFGASPGPADPDWLTGWQQADQKASAALHAALDLERWPNGPVVARDVVDALPAGSLLVLGSSNPTRDVALAANHRPDVVVHRNRGVAGIDGTVSAAIGSALAHGGPSYALLGDLTFLHDSNGLMLGPQEQRPDLTIVVLNDDGGGIFSLLEQGSPEHRGSFERVFGTPHGTDIGSLCAAHGVEHTVVRQRSEFGVALRRRPGLRVVEVRADRAELRGVHERLHAAVRGALHG
ncbi:2-succinyl-5-enolpyruvyl-6-hydroxy-3-cyclohexene-1-carboxylate synthase [Saccharopolyspora erythraea NRRL 2338]|uniref:2-succinyl-5-enolpyruvyl-6-hydroxy-3-cyclohexene-1-carboxylate synthase n=2 Tax=Saccharopolyspora erythraea TaxID=1836 RepID=MEND_SACEN|nr:2-succinyl-5-enolpyruvyl-6-hydroxy-3-cyclohexene-1-carboxylic-acid synthase [Saccharopolyspora erythraea]A4FPV1.1 RecName: Full=2-succinyl-5-enolpyruvyl-6-hydroxy-3-cyclohexene-1-carboxylate synthase; Short=SEPHCHC synthase; AltName: Full=Menaquinone biosynthesis protein MenD [Saccharopolyspora erythraea NRRL 2338]EQD84549.1 2-succinyl-5-enolpyruvyl-6-hydroxy-3-cyclohexene-1-carboxylate synthase [Saccharopolyspora erythraea D]PFG99721.1 2-succinyl-5-enolpyruvyl-6-hydroxy-3-cyclohexene-1-carbo